MQSKIFVSSILTTFPCVKQNPTANNYLPAKGLVSCYIDTGQINLILHSKDGSHLCMVPAVREECSGKTGPPISYQGQGDGTTLNRFPDTPFNYHFSDLAYQSKLKLNLHVHVPLKPIHQTYEYIRGFYAKKWHLMLVSLVCLT